MMRVMVLRDDTIDDGLHMMGLVMSSIYDIHVVRYWQGHKGVAKYSAAPEELSVWVRPNLSHSESKRSRRVAKAARKSRSAMLVPAILPEVGTMTWGR